MKIETAPSPRSISPFLQRLVIILTGICICIVVTSRHLTVLFYSLDPDGSQMTAIKMAGLQFVLITPLLSLLAHFWPTNDKYYYKSLLVANIFCLIMSPMVLLDPKTSQVQAGAQIILGILFLILIRRKIFDKKIMGGIENPSNANLPEGETSQNRWWIWIVVLLFIISIPWLSLGSPGSFLDTCLMLGVGIVVAAIFVRLLEISEYESPLVATSKLANNAWMEGLKLWLLLLLISSSLSFPFGGIQLALMITLPGLGWTVSYIKHSGWMPKIAQPPSKMNFHSTFWQNPILWVVSGTAAIPLIFSDPEELQLLLGMEEGEILGWVFIAAFLSSVLIFMVNLLLRIRMFWSGAARDNSLQEEKGITLRTIIQIIITAGIILTAVYIVNHYGKPGQYGENMFVVLEDQADLTSLNRHADPIQKRESVFSALIAHAENSQQDLRHTLNRVGVPYKPYYLVNALLVPYNPILRLWLNCREDVDRILVDPVLRPLPRELPVRSGNDPAPAQAPWNLSAIQADDVWVELDVRGEGIIIGQSDSGVELDHPELLDSYRGVDGNHDSNWYDPWNGSASPVDFSGHGTHTLATILGNQTGVAPDAQWIACVNLARNLGSPSRYLDCMQFMLAPFPQNADPFKDGQPSIGANILNNSWGCPEIEGCDDLVFQPAVSALKQAGIFFVASAGNDGPSCASLNVPPPIYAETFAVGAIDRYGELADFSSIGPISADESSISKPDLLAPGVSILSALPQGSYGKLSGTSMAGPHVAGVIALMWSANSMLIGDIDRTTQILIETADPYSGSIPDCPGAQSYPSTASGYGLVNAYKAVLMAVEAK